PPVPARVRKRTRRGVTRRSRFGDVCVEPQSASDDRDFEVLARDDCCRITAPVEGVNQRHQVAMQRMSLLIGEDSEGSVARAVPVSEHVNPMVGRLVSEDELARRHLKCPDLWKERSKVLLGSPARGGCQPGRRWDVTGGGGWEVCREETPSAD